MSSLLLSLVWKECRERRWVFLAGAGWMAAAALYSVLFETAYRIRSPIGSYSGSSMLFGLLAPVFLAMGTALGEVGRGSLRFTRGLPIRLPRVAAVRILGGIACLAGPILIGAVVMSVALGTGLVEQAERRPFFNSPMVRLPERGSMSPWEAIGFLWTVSAITCASSVQLLLIVSLLGARRRAEAHVGFLGAVLAFPWLLGTGLGMDESVWTPWMGVVLPQSLVINYGYGLENGLTYTDLAIPASVFLPLAGNLPVLVGLGWGFTRRYGTRPDVGAVLPTRRLRLPRMPALLSRLRFRWPGRIAALIWLDLRQAVPLALAGLALAILTTAAEVLPDNGMEYQEMAGVENNAIPERIAGNLPGSVWIVGMLWGAVVGAGVFASELRPNLAQFWRSRPISPSIWFWVKYVCGLTAVLVILDGTALVAGKEYAMFVSEPNNRMSWSYLACLPLLHAWMYSIAVAGVCLLRRPVPGAFCALGVMALVTIVTGAVPAWTAFEPIEVYNSLVMNERQGNFNLRSHGYPIVYGLLALTAGGAATFAWRKAVCFKA